MNILKKKKSEIEDQKIAQFYDDIIEKSGIHFDSDVSNITPQNVSGVLLDRLRRASRDTYDLNILESCLRKYYHFPLHLKELVREIISEFSHVKTDINETEINYNTMLLSCAEALKSTNGREKVLMLIDALKPRIGWTEDEIAYVNELCGDSTLIDMPSSSFRYNVALRIGSVVVVKLEKNSYKVATEHFSDLKRLCDVLNIYAKSQALDFMSYINSCFGPLSDEMPIFSVCRSLESVFPYINNNYINNDAT